MTYNPAAMTSLFLTQAHEASGRTAILEETEGCIWLYVTAPGSQDPELDCWLANTIPFADMPELDYFRGWQLPPPVIEDFAGPDAVMTNPGASQWQLQWSDDGSSATAICDGHPVGRINLNPPQSLSVHLDKSGPWGDPWVQGE